MNCCVCVIVALFAFVTRATKTNGARLTHNDLVNIMLRSNVLELIFTKSLWVWVWVSVAPLRDTPNLPTNIIPTNIA